VSTANASVTVGRTGTPSATTPAANQDVTQRQVTSPGPGYTVPSTDGIVAWTLTSWSTQANAATSRELELKVFRELGSTTFQVVAHDGPRPLTPSTLNTFATSLQVKPGDILGFHTTTFNTGADLDGVVGDVQVHRAGDLADGASDSTFAPTGSLLLNISAQLTPTNTFTVSATTRNKKKGNATVTVSVPNPGELSLSGKGVKAAVAQAGGPGDVQLVIRAKGKQSKTLKAKGKVKLKPTITFTPSGGEASSQSLNLTLKKKL
jgi:hypothetical protein